MPLILIITIASFVYVCQSAAYAQTPGMQQSADNTSPTITTPNDPVIAEATGPQGAIVSFDVSALDDVGGNIVPQCIPSSGSTFRMGETTVNCTSIDGADNLEEKSFEVIRCKTPYLQPQLLKQPRLDGWAKLRTRKHNLRRHRL